VSTLKIAGSTALVTGANRGLGRAFALALLAGGAETVYAGARDPQTVTDPGLVPVKLDVTDPADVTAAAELCADTTLLVNNAGILRGGSLLAAPGPRTRLHRARRPQDPQHEQGPRPQAGHRPAGRLPAQWGLRQGRAEPLHQRCRLGGVPRDPERKG